jgi:hypothetical protein
VEEDRGHRRLTADQGGPSGGRGNTAGPDTISFMMIDLDGRLGSHRAARPDVVVRPCRPTETEPIIQVVGLRDVRASGRYSEAELVGFL